MGLKADIKAAINANTTAPHKTRMVTAFTNAYGYKATLVDGTPNPQTPFDFTVECITNFIQEVVKSQETQAAREAVAPSTGITIN